MQENQTERKSSIGRVSSTTIDLPTGIFMLDVSADKTRMAVIYDSMSTEAGEAEEGKKVYKLRLYDLPTETNGKIAKQNEEFGEKDVSFINESSNPNYVFLSCSGENGYVALSFLEMTRSGWYTNPSKEFSKCYIYRSNKSTQKIPFQGRVVFLENRLVLVGQNTVEVYTISLDGVIKKGYTLDTEPLTQGYEATKHQDNIIKDLSWAKFVSDEPRKIFPVAAQDIITMSRHISNNILVTQYGSNNGGSVVRIWSIFDGTLLTSYKSKNVEHVMAISDNYRYIATYDEEEKAARIYCTKTSLVLHTIPINAQVDIINSNYTLTYMRFFGDGRYIIISGYKPDTEKPKDYRKFFFEVWCVPAHKLLLTDEMLVYYKSTDPTFSTISPFAMEFKNSSDKDAKRPKIDLKKKNDKKFKPGRQYNLPEVRAIYTTRNSNNQTSTQIIAKTLFKQDWIYSLDKVPQTWKISKGPNSQEPLKCKITLLKEKNEKYMTRMSTRPELNEPLNEFQKLLCYSIQVDTDYYILRFGYYTVQLWRLKKMDLDASEADKLKKGFQLKEEDSPYFYKSMEDSELVYIRTYKATDYGTGFTFKEDWNIHIKSDVPEVLFMDETGHIFVEMEHQFDYCKGNKNQPSDQNSRKLLETLGGKWPFTKLVKKNDKLTYKILDVDEIFLPISKTPSISTNNRSSTIDYVVSSTDSNFHEIESACRALHHINGSDTSKNRAKLSDEKLGMFNDKIYQIILRLLDLKKTVKFFTTVSGSRTLAMLASFPLGQNILKYIITTPRIPINIFSYAKEKNVQESMLTVLIEENKDDLFKVFFNRVLTDSYDAGPGNLSAVMDCLLYLQDQGISELLLNCSKKLSYIPVKIERHPILGSEYSAKIKMKSLQQDYIPSLRTLESSSALEQINKYDNTPRDRFLFRYARFKRNEFIMYLRAAPSTLYWLMFGESKTTTSLARLCVVPLPRFNDYKIQPEENIYNDDEKQNDILYNETNNGKSFSDNKKISKSDSKVSLGNHDSDKIDTMKEKDAFEKIEYQKLSPFTSTASSSSDNQIFKQGDTVMEVLTQYKWKTFARSKFFWILFIHSIYYISYSTGVSFSQELYGYKPGDVPTHPGHYASIVLMFVSAFILLLQEFRQFRVRKLEYITSFYNLIDLAAFALPIAAFGLLLTGSDLLLDVDSVAVLVLWTHAILRLRVFCQFGKLLEIIIQLSGKIMPIICIMILVVFAFTHAFIIRLRLFDDQKFQEQYQGGATNEDGSPLDNATTYTIYDVSSSNEFSNVFKAFSIVWFFIFGIFDPINDGDVGDDTMTVILAIVFSFVTVLIFSNMVIALMSSTVEDVKRRGNKAWISHFAAVVAEVEMLWCTSRERYDRKNNPSYIYYVANAKTVKSHVELMRDETKKLIEELNDEEN
ncbi:hypothetical protein K501DRAFT_307808 [Backusella circina FSU 941]|nr:hypothetical protein K501DRAFT_307808 [Backusella circina FSU 941]